MVSFYGSVTPLIYVVAILLFIANFWLDKFNLLKRSSNPEGIGKAMGTMMLRIMEWDIIVFAWGNMQTLGVIYYKQQPAQDYHSYVSNWLRMGSIQMLFVGFLIAVGYKVIATIVGWLLPEEYEKTKSYS
jgi:hypothetical protein